MPHHKSGDIVEVVSSVEKNEKGDVKKVNHEAAIVVGYDDDAESYSLVKISDLGPVYSAGHYKSNSEAGVGAVKSEADKPKSEKKPANSGGKKK